MSKNRRDLEIVAEPGKPTIVIRRTFDAPKQLLWDVSTKPEHLRNWWGPHELKLIVCEIDLRVGGKYRLVSRAPDGGEAEFYGEFKELSPPDLLVRTFVFAPYPDAPALETVLFEERDGKTRMTTPLVQVSVEARDGMLNAGMEPGMIETHARLDELLAKLQQR